MSKMMICLVGEQPVPNFLPIRSYRPDNAILMYTERTKDQSKHLFDTISQENSRGELRCSAERCFLNDAYNVDEIKRALASKVGNIKPGNLIFNLTGGTKTMALAGYEVACTRRGSTVIYVESQSDCSYCYEYEMADVLVRRQRFALQPTDIAVHFRLYGAVIPESATVGQDKKQGERQKIEEEIRKANDEDSKRGHQFALAVFDAIYDKINSIEVLASVHFPDVTGEIDLVLRCRNNVAVAEVKSGGAARGMKAIQQLLTFSGTPYGTYTKRLLITDDRRDSEPADSLGRGSRVTHMLRHRIERYRLPAFESAVGIREKHQAELRTSIARLLGCNKEC